MPEQTEEATLRTITEMNFSMAPNRILVAAVKLGVFSAIAAGRAAPAEIATAVNASERGTRMLLDAVTAFGLLKKDEGRYSLSRAAAQYLVRESPDYMGFVLEKDLMWESWGRLPEAVLSGKPLHPTGRKEAEEFFPILVRTLHITNREPARRLAQHFASDTTRELRVLDVGCGSGVWGMALAEANPRAFITAQDFPKVLDLTRNFVNARGLMKRYDFLPGDLGEVDYGVARFDLAILGNICHGMGERGSRALFARLHPALGQGGRVAIVEMLPNEHRSGPVYPLVFALNMLLNTEDGGTFSLQEYTGWLKAAGYGHVTTVDINLNSPAIIAIKE